jgi:hypothetical protein
VLCAPRAAGAKNRVPTPFTAQLGADLLSTQDLRRPPNLEVVSLHLHRTGRAKRSRPIKWTQIAVALTVHKISDFAATRKEFGPVRSATDCFLIYHLASEIDKFVLFSQHNTIELFSFVPLSAHLDKTNNEHAPN